MWSSGSPCWNSFFVQGSKQEVNMLFPSVEKSVEIHGNVSIQSILSVY